MLQARHVETQEQFAKKTFFTKIAQAGLFKLDPVSGAETLLTRKVNPAHLDGWLVLAGQVFYIEPQAVCAVATGVRLEPCVSPCGLCTEPAGDRALRRAQLRPLRRDNVS